MSPIRVENRDRYPPEWKALSSYIRFVRAGGRCEHRDENGRRCEARNGMPTPASLHAQGMGYEMPWQWWDIRGDFPPVVLTVAHLDHTPENCEVWNLAAWCQKHHLAYDMHIHQANRRETMRRRIREAGQLELEGAE